MDDAARFTMDDAAAMDGTNRVSMDDAAAMDNTDMDDANGFAMNDADGFALDDTGNGMMRLDSQRMIVNG